MTRALLNRLLLQIPERTREVIRRSPFMLFARAATSVVSPSDWTQWTSVRAGRLKGAKLLLQPRSEWAFAWGVWEPAVHEALDLYLDAESVLWDVGAHIGLTALYGAVAVGERGLVVAFEPDPQNLRRLRANIGANEVRNIVVVDEAVGSFAGTALLQQSATGAMSRIADHGIRVKMTTLDAALTRFRPPTMVKLDVEGHERDILRGAERLLREQRPVAVIEVHNEADREAVATELLNVQYRITWISNQHLLAAPEEKADDQGG